MAAFSRSTSAEADFICWPATANCSVIAAMRASDSFNFERAKSNSACLDSISCAAVLIANLRRSHSFVSVCNSPRNFSINALTSISEFVLLEPPRARDLVKKSPSRVTTVTSGWLRRISAASAAVSVTTVLPNKSEIKSFIDEDRICAVMEVNPPARLAAAEP